MVNIKREIEKIKRISKKYGKEFNNDQAFNVLNLQYLCFKEDNLESIWVDLISCITDGSYDGGIDYIFYDEDDNKIIIGQNKYSENILNNDIKEELGKIRTTLSDFKQGRSARYNSKVKEKLQDSLDRLTDETQGNIDIYFSSLSYVDTKKLRNETEDFANEVSGIIYYNPSEIFETIDKLRSSFEVVADGKLNLDKANHYVEYENDDRQGVFLNVSSKSLIKLYNKYHTNGLFNLNIRQYIKNKTVDEGITNTLRRDRDNFWFLNNGLTIACSDYYVEGNVIKLYDFSIVNGGQTTTLIGKYTGSNADEDFYIPCKVIKSKNQLDLNESLKFFNDIAEATNSQKPIQPKDLKSNAPEMIGLKKVLSDRKINLEIKRGTTKEKFMDYNIRNDIFAQLIFSFVYQKPGTSRSSKNSLFTNNTYYSQIFKQKYTKDANKLNFIVDLIDLNERYKIIENNIKSEKKGYQLDLDSSNIFKNSKLTLFALFGVIYRIINNDIEKEELKRDIKILDNVQFEHASFISNYKEDDINDKILQLIKFLVEILHVVYQRQYREGKVTSVSNFLKTDSKYRDEILREFISNIDRQRGYDELFDENGYGIIFKRHNE